MKRYTCVQTETFILEHILTSSACNEMLIRDFPEGESTHQQLSCHALLPVRAVADFIYAHQVLVGLRPAQQQDSYIMLGGAAEGEQALQAEWQDMRLLLPLQLAAQQLQQLLCRASKSKRVGI